MADFHPLLAGAYELHCHSAPSIFARRQNDWQLAADMEAAGMGGGLLKSHESLSAIRAELIRTQEPGLDLYGGLVCNYFTGGLSPYAVDAAIRLGARCIWLPTISSAAHFSHFTHKETTLFQSEKPVRQPEQGLEIWDKQKNILPQVHEILALVAEANIILATGHISPEEVLAVTQAARDHGIGKILIQHADMAIARVPMDMQLELARRGAKLEKCYLATSPDCNDLTVEEMAGTMRQLGYASCVMVTDYGQSHNVPVVQALGDFIDDILACDVSEGAIRQMIVDNPRRLLDV